VIRGHLPALHYGVMDPAPALYMIRINGHLGATGLSAFPAHPGGGPGHPVVPWYELGEDWYWCYLDRLVFELDGAPAAPSHL